MRKESLNERFVTGDAMQRTQKIGVLLADHHTLFREGLRALLADVPDVEVVSDVADGRMAVEESCRCHVDVVLIDITMPDLNGIDATRKIVLPPSPARVLCVSAHTETHLVTAILEAGASGFLPKTGTKEELLRAIHVVSAGEMYLSPAVTSSVVRQRFTGAGEYNTGGHGDLTQRERNVLQLIAECHHTKDIADQLQISPKTVLSHRESVMTKLQIDSIAGLTRYALREGLAVL